MTTSHPRTNKKVERFNREKLPGPPTQRSKASARLVPFWPTADIRVQVPVHQSMGAASFRLVLSRHTPGPTISNLAGAIAKEWTKRPRLENFSQSMSPPIGRPLQENGRRTRHFPDLLHCIFDRAVRHPLHFYPVPHPF